MIRSSPRGIYILLRNNSRLLTNLYSDRGIIFECGILSSFVISFWISFYYKSALYPFFNKRVIIRFIGSRFVSFIITKETYNSG
jgi:hypothetical protein